MRGGKLVFVAGVFIGENLSKLRSREGTDKQTKKERRNAGYTNGTLSAAQTNIIS